MALLGGNIYCNLETNVNGSGTEDSPYSPSQLSAVLGAATGLASSVNVLWYGTKVLSAGNILDLSTPLMTSGNPAFTLTFKKKNNIAKCPSIYCEDGLHVNPSLVKLGGGNFTTIFADTLVHVRGDLNATLQGLVEVTGINEVILDNTGLVGNNLSNFKQGGASCCTPTPSFSELSSIAESSGITDFIKYNNYLITVSPSGAAILVYNVSNPNSPTLHSSCGGFSPNGVAILGTKIIFTAQNSPTIRLFDIQSIIDGDSSTPEWTGSIPGGNSFSINSGNRILITSDNGRVYSYDYTGPGLTLISNSGDTTAVWSKAIRIDLSSGSRDVSLHTNKFNLWNNGNVVASRNTVNTVPTNRYLHAAFKPDSLNQGGYLYVATNAGGVLKIEVWHIDSAGNIDVSVTNVITVGSFNIDQIEVMGDHLFVSTNYTIRIYDITDPTTPVFLEESAVNTASNYMQSVDDVLYSSSTDTGLTNTLNLYSYANNTCCCTGTNGGFLPVICNSNTKVFDNTWVVEAANPELLDVPNMGKFNSLVHNMMILGNVAYTFLIPTNTSTKAEGNFFFKVASEPVSVIDMYETTVLTPEGLADVGDFSAVHPLGNVVGSRFTLNLKYSSNSVGKGKDSIPNTSALDDNYPLFSNFSNSDAGYACATETEGDVITTLDGKEVLVVSNLVDSYDPKKTYTLFVEANGDLSIAKTINPQSDNTQIGSDSDLK